MFNINDALIMAKMCAFAYEDKDEVFSEHITNSKFATLKSLLLREQNLFDPTFGDTEVYLVFNRDRGSLILIFRGSESSTDWIGNLGAIKTRIMANEKAKVHAGFLSAYRLVREKLIDCLEKNFFIPNAPLKNNLGAIKEFHFTGHSLGGALATIAAYDFSKNIFREYDFKYVCYTFGSPRVGDQAFKDEFNRKIDQCYRVVNNSQFRADIVTSAPTKIRDFHHVGEQIDVSSGNFEMLHRIAHYREGLYKVKKCNGLPYNGMVDVVEVFKNRYRPFSIRKEIFDDESFISLKNCLCGLF